MKRNRDVMSLEIGRIGRPAFLRTKHRRTRHSPAGPAGSRSDCVIQRQDAFWTHFHAAAEERRYEKHSDIGADPPTCSPTYAPS